MRKKGYAAAGIWAMLARESIYKIVAVLAVMTGVQIGLFYGRLKDLAAEELIFESVWNDVGATYVFLAAFCAVFGILLWTLGEHGSRDRYTLLRLPLTWRQILLLRLLYNVLCFTLLFAVQAGIILWMMRIYSTVAEAVTSQMVFLAFYRIPFLHNVLPMAEAGKWVRNLLMFLALSLEAAAGYRRKGYAPALMLAIVVVSWVFGSETGTNLRDAFCDIMLLICIGGTLWGMWESGEEQEDEKEA